MEDGGALTMPSDKIKPPDNFPEYFQLPFARGLGKWWLLSSEDKQPCLALARKYRAFLKSIPLYPLHPLNSAMTDKQYRTKVEQQANGEWSLFVVVNRKIDWDGIMEGKNSPK
jgi:hypothetical protein